MIFVTVGTQLPFDRLIRAVDTWCSAGEREEVFGQIARPGAAGYVPTQFEWQEFLDPEESRERFSRATMVIAHAGMGSIISALSMGKPIVIMPRMASLGEHRNDHQAGTARRFATRPGIFVANDEKSFSAAADSAINAVANYSGGSRPEPDPRLINCIRNFIFLDSPTTHGRGNANDPGCI